MVSSLRYKFMNKRAYDNTKRDQKKIETRNTIVEAMTTLLARGEEDLSVVKLAALAGVSRRTVYQHFPDKAARVKAINDWVEGLVDVGSVLPTSYEDIPSYIERRIDYIFQYESLIRVVMASGLAKQVLDSRRQKHKEYLSKALRERIADEKIIDELVGVILATLRANAIYDMRDLYKMNEDRIKASFSTMINSLLVAYRK